MPAGRGDLVGDLSAVDALFIKPATVVFVRADASQAELCRYTVPQRIMDYDPMFQQSEVSERGGPA